MRDRGGGQKPRDDRDGPWSNRRPYLSPEDLTLLQQLGLPGENLYSTLRRIIREAVARKPIDEALRDLEARLARIEASGLCVNPPVAQPAEDSREAVQRVMATWRSWMDDDDAPPPDAC